MLEDILGAEARLIRAAGDRRQIDVVEQNPAARHQALQLEDIVERPGVLVIPIDKRQRQRVRPDECARQG